MRAGRTGFWLAALMAMPAWATPMATAPETFNLLGGVDNLTEGFDTDTITFGCVAGWTCTNNSAPGGTRDWFEGQPIVSLFVAQAGGPSAYIAADFNDTVGNNTISNWLISPEVNFASGAQLRFWTRSRGYLADRLEVRVSHAGASTDVGTTTTSVGDFSTTLATINPALQVGASTCPPDAAPYPSTAWCEIVLTNAHGLPSSGSGRVALRYFVTNGGTTGTNSDYIGIDTFSYSGDGDSIFRNGFN